MAVLLSCCVVVLLCCCVVVLCLCVVCVRVRVCVCVVCVCVSVCAVCLCVLCVCVCCVSVCLCVLCVCVCCVGCLRLNPKTQKPQNPKFQPFDLQQTIMWSIAGLRPATPSQLLKIKKTGISHVCVAFTQHGLYCG